MCGAGWRSPTGVRASPRASRPCSARRRGPPACSWRTMRRRCRCWKTRFGPHAPRGRCSSSRSPTGPGRSAAPSARVRAATSAWTARRRNCRWRYGAWPRAAGTCRWASLTNCWTTSPGKRRRRANWTCCGCSRAGWTTARSPGGSGSPRAPCGRGSAPRWAGSPAPTGRPGLRAPCAVARCWQRTLRRAPRCRGCAPRRAGRPSRSASTTGTRC